MVMRRPVMKRNWIRNWITAPPLEPEPVKTFGLAYILGWMEM